MHSGLSFDLLGFIVALVLVSIVLAVIAAEIAHKNGAVGRTTGRVGQGGVCGPFEPRWGWQVSNWRR